MFNKNANDLPVFLVDTDRVVDLLGSSIISNEDSGKVSNGSKTVAAAARTNESA